MLKAGYLGKSGERFIPHQTNPNEAIINVARYFYAMNHLKDKIVCEVGCGCGLGTYLYSLVAKKIYAVDYSEEAIEYAKQYPLKDNVEFIEQNLEKYTNLPEHEVLVAIEFLEHLEDPLSFLKAQKSRELVFSLPRHSLAVSSWHKFDIESEADVKTLMAEAGYRITNMELQENLWFYGHAIKL